MGVWITTSESHDTQITLVDLDESKVSTYQSSFDTNNKVALLGCRKLLAHATLLVHRDNNLVGLEVGRLGIVLIGHPHAGTSGSNRLGSAHIRKDDMPIKLASFVDPLGRSIEVGPTAHHTLPSLLGSLLPSPHKRVVDGSIEGNNRERRNLGKSIKLIEEEGKHTVGDRARLINGDRNVGNAIDLDTRMDTRITLVNTLDGRRLVTTLRNLHEIAEHLPPIHGDFKLFHDSLALLGGNRAPIVGLGARLHGILQSFLQTLLCNLVCGVIHPIGLIGPTGVIIEGIGLTATVTTIVGLAIGLIALALTILRIGLLLLFLLLFESFKVEFCRLAKRKVSERTNARNASNLGDIGKVGIDRKITSDIPHFGHALGRHTTRNVIVNKVIELVTKNVGTFGIRKTHEESGIVGKLKLTGILVHSHTSGRNGGSSCLVHTTRKSGIERLGLQEPINVHIKVEIHFGLSLRGSRVIADGGLDRAMVAHTLNVSRCRELCQ